MPWHCSRPLNAGWDEFCGVLIWEGSLNGSQKNKKRAWRHDTTVWTYRLCWGLSIHCLNHVLVRFWHSVTPVWQAIRMAFTWLYLKEQTASWQNFITSKPTPSLVLFCRMLHLDDAWSFGRCSLSNTAESIIYQVAAFLPVWVLRFVLPSLFLVVYWTVLLSVLTGQYVSLEPQSSLTLSSRSAKRGVLPPSLNSPGEKKYLQWVKNAIDL